MREKITAKNFDVDNVSLSDLEKATPRELAKIVFRLSLEIQRRDKIEWDNTLGFDSDKFKN